MNRLPFYKHEVAINSGRVLAILKAPPFKKGTVLRNTFKKTQKLQGGYPPPPPL